MAGQRRIFFTSMSMDTSAITAAAAFQFAKGVTDRERVVEGKRGEFGGRRIIKKKKKEKTAMEGDIEMKRPQYLHVRPGTLHSNEPHSSRRNLHGWRENAAARGATVTCAASIALG